MSNVVSYELVGNIGVISVNSPPVNALSQAVREGILNAVMRRRKMHLRRSCCAARAVPSSQERISPSLASRRWSLVLPEVLSAIENSRSR